MNDLYKGPVNSCEFYRHWNRSLQTYMGYYNWEYVDLSKMKDYNKYDSITESDFQEIPGVLLEGMFFDNKEFLTNLMDKSDGKYTRYNDFIDGYAANIASGLSDWGGGSYPKDTPTDNYKNVESEILKIEKPPYIKAIYILDNRDNNKIKYSIKYFQDSKGNVREITSGIPCLDNFNYDTASGYDLTFMVIASKEVKEGILRFTYEGSSSEFNFESQQDIYQLLDSFKKEQGIAIEDTSKYKLYSVKCSIPYQRRHELKGFYIYQKTEFLLNKDISDDKRLDNDPETVAMYDGTSPVDKPVFKNHEIYAPKIYSFYYDKSNPFITEFSVTTVTTASYLNYGDKGYYSYNPLKGDKEVKPFQDLKAEKYRLSIKLCDDGLDFNSFRIYLVPTDKPGVIQALNDAIKMYNSQVDSVAGSDDEKITKRVDLYLGLVATLDSFGKYEFIRVQIKPKEWSEDGKISFNSKKSINQFKLEHEINEISAWDQGKYRVLFVGIDKTGKRIVANLNESGFDITKNKSEQFTYFGQDASDGTTMNSNDYLDDGAFLSPEFNIDYTPPVFTFNLGDLFSNFAEGVKDALILALKDNLSRNIHVVIKSQDRKNGEELYKWEFVVHNADAIVDGDYSRVSVETISGIPVEFRDGKFYIKWDLYKFLKESGKLAQGLNGMFTVEVTDDAGNSWVDKSVHGCARAHNCEYSAVEGV